MTRALRLLFALLALALVAAACASDDPSSVIASGTSSDTSEPAEPEPTAEEAMDEEAMDEGSAAEQESAMGSDAFPVTVADITIESQPMRIVSLSPTATEMLFAVGAGGQVIAADDFSNYPPEAPTTDLSGFTPNVEAIAGFEPDLIVAQAPIEGIDVLGVPVLVQFAAASFDDVYSQIEQIGAATGHVGGAAEVVGQMQTDIDRIVADLPADAAGLTYFHELDNTLYSVTSATFIGSVYSLLGLENIADASDPDGAAFGYPQLTEEAIVAADPDLIFLADTKCCGQSAATVAERESWTDLRAVQAGNIVELDDDVASRWGPRLVDFLQAIADGIAAVVPAAS